VNVGASLNKGGQHYVNN